MITARELVTRLLDATPEPPATGDGDQLLAAFEAIYAQIDAFLSEREAVLALAEPPLTLSDADRPLLAELERRQNGWHVALAAALRRVGEQRCGAAQVRAYAGPR